MPHRIYLDHAATTPLSDAARHAMLPWLDAGNASSLYQEGRQATEEIDTARESVSEALKCLFAEVIFTSGGTEAANLAILGVALANEDSKRNRVLLGAAEHHCVLHTSELLARLGYRVELVGVDREARLDLTDLREKLGPDVLLVSAMHANNELGSINPIETISNSVRDHGALLHVDAVQTFLRPEAGPVASLVGADLMSVSAHKVNGPKGAGALFVRGGTKIKALVGGGGQEREVRGGTENVAAIAGFGAAVRAHLASPPAIEPEWRERLARRLEELGAVRSVTQPPLLHSHAHVRFPGIDAETLLIALDRAGVSASSGAACSSGSVEPSHVLLACGYTAREAKEGLRLTLGPTTELEQIEEAADRIGEVLTRFERS